MTALKLLFIQFVSGFKQIMMNEVKKTNPNVESKIAYTVVIEDPNTDEWGLSFASHNPEEKDYVAVASEADAYKLQKIIEESFMRK